MRFKTLLLCAAVAFGATACAAQAQQPTPYYVAPSFDGVARTSEYIEGHDGVRLAVSIYRPTRVGTATDERFPVIVTQMRSQMDEPRNQALMRYFTDRGYVWVAQDRRGTGASFGRQTGFVNPNDVKDAKSVIDWAAGQTFSSGKVVALGCSNQGAWQYGVAALAPEPLVAIAPGCASPQFFDDAVIMNGVPIFTLGETHFDGTCPPSGEAQTGGRRRSSGDPTSTRPVDDDADGILLRQAQAGQTCNAPMLGQFWLDMPRDGHNSLDDYQPALQDSAVTHLEAIKRSGIGVLSLGGWYDAALSGQFAAQSYWGGRVIIGPWVHGNRTLAGMSYPNADLDLNAETLRWFDHYAKGIENGAETPGVLYYTVNAPAGDEWKSADLWSWAGDETRTLFFGEEGLSTAAPARATPPLNYQGRDVPWFDGSYQPLRHIWTGDTSITAAQSLSQLGPVLSHEIEVTGTPVARLWVSADTPDVNVFAMLEDVAPDGRATYVTDGHIRASWRALHPSPWGVEGQHWHRGFAEDRRPLDASVPNELVFDLYPISYVFKAGHRMRISLVTSIGNDYQAPPLAEGRAPMLTLYRDAQHASRIEIPISH